MNFKLDGRNRRKIECKKRYCIVCNCEIIRNTKSGEKRTSPKQYNKSKFCSKKCKGIYLSNKIKGGNNPNWKGGVSVCIDCGKLLSQRYVYRNTLRCRKCWNKYNIGERSSKWKGGITPENEILRHNKEYRDWRTKVFERDSYTCQICGDSRGGNLNAHHIKEWAKYKELRYNVNNGTTLCKECHINIHKKKKLWNFQVLQTELV